MAWAPGNSGNATDLLEVQGPCTAPLDAAAEYLRRRIEWILPLYVLAMAPHAMVIAWLIDAMVGERRAMADRYCAYLVAATVWRWCGLTCMQRQVQKDLRVQQTEKLRSRILAILLFRLISSIAMTWGSLLAGVPAFVGLFIGSFAAPALLENSDSALTRLRQMLSWIQHSAGRLLKIAISITFITALLLIAILASQWVLVNTILPQFMGMNTADLTVTTASWPWRFGILYLVFLLIDLFWTVASVFIYYDSQSRRMATDLRARLVSLIGATA